ncbi:MAG: response regulator transcription factor [Clostridia bacterium]|nr:response regulator transcription factor [Clostridia bacterium]MBO4869043.1 response regulator transcription factor [Clostridia bacterium]
MTRILIADDDRSIAELISDALTDEGYVTEIVGDGEEALRRITADPDYSLIILDVMMPKTDGLEVCRRVRERVNCPIIFVSAKNRTIDTLLGLGMGADDYVAKPFVLDELVARVKAHIRREQRSSPVSESNVIRCGQIEIHRDTYSAYKAGRKIPVSAREFQLLQYMMENEGKVLSRDQIFEAVWGTDYGDPGTVAVNIKNLRDKIDAEGKYIKTVWGVGYKFTPVE